MNRDESVDVILLRSADDPDPYLQAVQDAGLQGVCQPVLRFVFPDNEALRNRLLDDTLYSGVVATSPRAARALRGVLDDVEAAQIDPEAIPAYVVGPKTAEQFRALGFDIRGAHTGNAEALATLIIDTGPDGRLLFLSGNRRRDTLPNALREADVPFDEQVVYETEIRSDITLPTPVTTPWLVFFSPSGVEAVRRSGETIEAYRCAAIGPTTAGRLRDEGIRVEAVADTPTPDDIVSAIESA